MAGRGVDQSTTDGPRLVPRTDLINVLDYETQAARRLTPPLAARIADSDRSVFDRVTLRPRMMVPTREMDLGVSLFGTHHFAPVLVGPVVGLSAFASEGAAAVVDGASAANAGVVLAHEAGLPLDALVARAKTPVWWQVYAGERDALAEAKRAAGAGCRVIGVTIGAESVAGAARAASVGAGEWRLVEAVAAATGLPVVVKGIASVALAKEALAAGAAGLVVSNHGGLLRDGPAVSVLDIPAVVALAAGRVPVLVDGGFRRGTDILKALAFGARAVFVARPVVWGLAAYGASGVQGVLELLQTELARYMAMCGRPSLEALDATVVRVHRDA